MYTSEGRTVHGIQQCLYSGFDPVALGRVVLQGRIPESMTSMVLLRHVFVEATQHE